MAEDLKISKVSRAGIYEELLPQLYSLWEGESDLIANLANAARRVARGARIFWVGFYIVKKDELVLGPFQGPVACTRIAKGKGVCGAAWQRGETILVPDVDAFPGHIACASASRSEIVIPIKNGVGVVVAVLDVDSNMLDDFSEIDSRYLGEVCRKLGEIFYLKYL